MKVSTTREPYKKKFKKIFLFLRKNGPNVYGKEFMMILGKVKYLNTSKKQNSKEQETTAEKMVRKRTLLCSRAGYSEHSEHEPEETPKRNQKSQRCGCSFFVRAALNDTNNLWYIINMKLTHNHQMVDENHQFFMLNERIIPDNVKQRIGLLHQAGVDVPTIIRKFFRLGTMH
jgi:hypothetical protein